MAPHIYIYSPSGAVRDRAAFRRGVRFLEKQGYRVEVDRDALSRSQRFAGSDQTRLEAVTRAAESGADIALIARGGYGLTRLLPSLPYELLSQAIARGTRFVGFSDFTALQLALFAQTGATTWSGPALCESFGVEEPDDIMVDCFADLVQRRGEGSGWRLPQARSPLMIKDAVLWGGNLATLCALVGTPYMPSIDGGVLFLEDVGEHPYRIERQITQLLHTGILGRQRAIVMGQFTGYQLSYHDRGFKLASVLEWLGTQTSVPVLSNLPFGHVPTKVLLPFGKRVDLVVEGRDALIVWGDE
ncbi:LD-carboxypeptidase [Curvibacter sp. APW13]|uniref:LD-carboxypeptidase n=1 Tax=Curvibacter sp. APW13 TaxID=3077236 RepID=UPI0028DFB532|nr:LD-carboxypeptidase [Curvibacter sp. APW13]MDT8991644.1 LD-carboxypeptidase [Curvibacter sp. APW13]